MRGFAARIRRRANERGASAVEYALTVSLIAAVIVVAVALLGRNSDDTYRCTVDSMAARSGACP